VRNADRHKERHETCVHAEACDQAYEKHARWYENATDWMPCDECKLYDSQHCPMSYSGTMRCRGRI